jgi:hypothetical protein
MSNRTSIRILVGCGLVLYACVASAVHAQEAGGGPRGSKGNVTVVPLSNGSEATFNWNGPFSLSAPNIHFGGSTATPSAPSPQLPAVPPPDPPLVDLHALAMDLFRVRAGNCLTGAEAAPCQPATPPPGAFNIRSTHANIDWLVGQTARRALSDMPLPGIIIQTNPRQGVTQMESWFWVDRGTYEGQPYSQTVRIEAPWTIEWDYLVHHHEQVHGPCPADPAQTCVIGFNDWDETRHHEESHVDVATATVTLNPTRYAWDFGDDSDGPWRSESHAAFSGLTGIGLPYRDPKSPSPVVHRYQRSSRDVFDQGGFTVRLQVRWTASAVVTLVTDGVLIESAAPVLPDRVGEYATLVRVRESQPVLTASAP